MAMRKTHAVIAPITFSRKSAMSSSRASFHWDDPLLLSEQLTDDERMVMDSARAYCQDKLKPRVLEAFRHEKMDATIFPEMGALGLLGPTIQIGRAHV